MTSTKTLVESQPQPPVGALIAKQPEPPEKSAGFAYVNGATSAASPPPNDGQAALRVAAMVNGAGGQGAAPLAQMMAHLQRNVGNVRVATLVRKELQPKLKVGSVDDPAEREADQVAAAVTQTTSAPEAHVRRLTKPIATLAGSAQRNHRPSASRAGSNTGGSARSLPRAPGAGARERGVQSDIESRIASPTGGKSLPPGLRREMEGHLGADFSPVRVHDKPTDQADAQRLNARAFTHGEHIWLGPGESAGDRKLMAHELTHVVQQSVTPNLAAQRWFDGPKLTNREKINKALASKDAGDVKDIDKITEATSNERLELLRLLAYQGWAGPMDEYKIEEIWLSFGDDAAKFMRQDPLLWNQCIDVGAELEKLPLVIKLREQFSVDVKKVALSYLSENRQFVLAEMARLGIRPDDEKISDPTAEQAAEIQNIQAAAAEVAKLQLAQEKVRGNVIVGYDPAPSEPQLSLGGDQPSESSLGSKPAFVLVTFNPFKPPTLDSAPPGAALLGTPVVKTTPYKEVKAKYDAATDHIEHFHELYPALYAITREGKSGITAAFAGKASPAQARQQLGSAMRSLLHDIDKAKEKVGDGKPNPLDLTPIHAQLYAGMKAPDSSVHWQDTLPKWVAKDLTADHDFNEALKDLLLETAAQAAFLLAPFTGGASLYVMLAGLALTGIKAYKSAEEYENLAQAAKTSVIPGTELVAPDQVERAKMIKDADEIALWLAAIAVGIAAAGKALASIKGPPGVKAPPLKSGQIGGDIIGWGTGQSAEAVEQTIQVTKTMTRASVKEWIAKGLTREWVESQLNAYTGAVTKGGDKLKNTQLFARKELMERILSLWPN